MKSLQSLDWTDLGVAVGITCVTYGLHLAWPPLSWLFTGAWVLFVTFVTISARQKK